jgi:hypothetical protein
MTRVATAHNLARYNCCKASQEDRVKLYPQISSRANRPLSLTDAIAVMQQGKVVCDAAGKAPIGS